MPLVLFFPSGAAFVKAAQAGYYDAIIVDSSDPIGILFNRNTIYI